MEIREIFCFDLAKLLKIEAFPPGYPNLDGVISNIEANHGLRLEWPLGN